MRNAKIITSAAAAAMSAIWSGSEAGLFDIHDLASPGRQPRAGNRKSGAATAKRAAKKRQNIKARSPK